MNVSLERINEDYLFEVTNSNGMSIHLDNKSKTTGQVKGISPMELLLMGVAGCSSIDIVYILNKQKIKPDPRGPDSNALACRKGRPGASRFVYAF